MTWLIANELTAWLPSPLLYIFIFHNVRYTRTQTHTHAAPLTQLMQSLFVNVLACTWNELWTNQTGLLLPLFDRALQLNFRNCLHVIGKACSLFRFPFFFVFLFLLTVGKVDGGCQQLPLRVIVANARHAWSRCTY